MKSFKPGQVSELGNAFSIGLAMVVAIIIGFGGGFLIDKHWPGASPWGKLTGLAVGIAAAYRNLHIMIMRVKKDLEKNERKPG